MEFKIIKQTLGDKSYKYAPYILLRSLEVWKSRESVAVPSEIRKLIELTYQEKEGEPDSWQELYSDWFGTDSARKMLANRNSNLWTVALEDEEGVQTRLNEIPTIPIVLCREVNRKEVRFLDNSVGNFGADIFQLSLAQSIHKNLVKIPAYCFDNIEERTILNDYLRGKGAIGIVSENGMVDVKELRDGIELYYSNDMGLLISKK